MPKYSWHEDYWHREQPSPDQRELTIPPRPLVAVPLLPRKPRPQYMVGMLVTAVGCCLWGAVVIWWVSP